MKRSPQAQALNPYSPAGGDIWEPKKPLGGGPGMDIGGGGQEECLRS